MVCWQLGVYVDILLAQVLIPAVVVDATDHLRLVHLRRSDTLRVIERPLKVGLQSDIRRDEARPARRRLLGALLLLDRRRCPIHLAMNPSATACVIIVAKPGLAGLFLGTFLLALAIATRRLGALQRVGVVRVPAHCVSHACNSKCYQEYLNNTI